MLQCSLQTSAKLSELVAIVAGGEAETRLLRVGSDVTISHTELLSSLVGAGQYSPRCLFEWDLV